MRQTRKNRIKNSTAACCNFVSREPNDREKMRLTSSTHIRLLPIHLEAEPMFRLTHTRYTTPNIQSGAGIFYTELSSEERRRISCTIEYHGRYSFLNLKTQCGYLFISLESLSLLLLSSSSPLAAEAVQTTLINVSTYIYVSQAAAE